MIRDLWLWNRLVRKHVEVPVYDPATIADWVWFAPNVEDFSDVATTTAGDSVKRFIDAVGGENPVFTGTSPVIDGGFDDGSGNNCAGVVDLTGLGLKGILFLNSRDNEYTKAIAAKAMPACSIEIIYKLDGLDGENTNKGNNAFNLRDKSDSPAPDGTGMRIGSDTTELVELGSKTEGFLSNAINIFQTNLNGSQSKVLRNRVQIAADVTTDDSQVISNVILGSQTNVTAHIKLGQIYFWERIPTDEELDGVYAYLTSQGYIHGRRVDAPYATGITFDQSTVPTDAIMKANWTNNTSGGRPITSVEVIWYTATNEGAPNLSVRTEFFRETLVGDVTTAEFNLNDYAVFNLPGTTENGSGVHINISVRPIEGDGTSFVGNSATDYKRDNIARFVPAGRTLERTFKINFGNNSVQAATGYNLMNGANDNDGNNISLLDDDDNESDLVLTNINSFSSQVNADDANAGAGDLAAAIIESYHNSGANNPNNVGKQISGADDTKSYVVKLTSVGLVGDTTNYNIQFKVNDLDGDKAIVNVDPVAQKEAPAVQTIATNVHSDNGVFTLYIYEPGAFQARINSMIIEEYNMDL